MPDDTLHQIALRLPAELLKAAADLAKSRKAALRRRGRFSEAHRQNRSAILREAIERGLMEISEEPGGERG
jgi:predicted DNA-binding protein